jgi:hypothetical protein
MLIEFAIAVFMRNKHEPRLPAAIGGRVIFLDLCRGIGISICSLQQFIHQFVVVLEVPTF